MKTAILANLLAAVTVAAAVPHNGHPGWSIGQTVKTTSGPVNGHAASKATEVSTYLGIPFAQPPIGDLRFAPTQKYRGKTLISGANYGYSCPSTGKTPPPVRVPTPVEIAFFSKSAPLTNTNEDCLTLNIWTKPQSGERKKAVLLWIYGGGFYSGSSALALTDGQHLADEEDVVVVSINYRLSILGFPGNPNESNNLGIQDQRLAIEWVNENIDKFGGDPSRITIFGQSAGAAAIDFYSYAYYKNPLVAGLILESGSTGLGANTKDYSAGEWFKVTSKLGCGDANSPPASVLSCMRGKSSEQIIAAIDQKPSLIGTSNFWPTVDNSIVFPDYPARSAQKKFAKIPMLIGNNNYESGIFKDLLSLSGLSLPESVWVDYNNSNYTCPSSNRAHINAEAGLSTWRYRYFGDFPNLRLTNVTEQAAYHGAELALVFDTEPLAGNGVPPSTDEEVALGKYIRGAWAAFAKDPKQGLEVYGWPKYGAGKETLIRLGYENRVGVNAVSPSVYDSVCHSV